MNDSPHDGAGFHGDGPMAALMRSHDWRSSKLGPPAQWPAELRTLVQLMLASSNPSFILWSRACLFLYNDAYAPLLGERHPAALGRSLPLAWPELWRAIAPASDEAFAGNASAFDDVPVVVQDGRQRWFSWSYTPVRGAAGEVAGMFNTGVETTARIMGEHKREFEHALVACLRNMSNPDQISALASALLGERLRAGRVGYADVDRSGHWVTMKADWTDGSAPSMAGQLQHIDDFGPEIQAALGNGELLRIDDIARDPRTAPYAGAYAAQHIGAVLAIPLLRHGGLRAILSVHQAGPRNWTDLDVALARQVVEHTWAAVEAARSHSELRQEQEQSRYILDNMDEGFALIDQDWTILDVNTIAAQLCRMPREQLVGRSQWEAVPELLATPVEALYRRVHASRKSEVIEHHHTYPGGRQAWIEIRVYPSLLGRLAIFFRDISKRKAVEHEVADASRRKDEFLAMLAHELRNPLAPIGAAADLLSLAKLDQERIRKTSAVISRQVKHMTSLVDDLLDVSRVTRGLVTLEQLPQDAGRVVNDAVEQVRPLMDARRQHLSLVLPPQAAYVRGDHKRLVQVLTNLMGNAAKYTPEGGNIVMEVAADAAQVTLSVADDGIGMTADLARRAFDLFAQAERTSDRSQGGLGLGLALVKSLVELHGGSVTAHSDGLGLGSRFTVCLPRIDAPAPPDTPDRRRAREQNGSGLHLLIVDDNLDAASMLGMFLEAAGHHVMIEHESRRAIERARLERPRVCLLDIGLPNMDGYELARRLRAQPDTAGTVLVAVTGYGQEQDRRRAIEAGFDFHFVKPVDTVQLIRLLKGIAAT